MAKKIDNYTMTRGAMYLLESCLQDHGPCANVEKLMQWSMVHTHVRRSNDRTIKPSFAPNGWDIEKPACRADAASDVEFARWGIEMRELEIKWKNEKAVLRLTNKHADICKDAIKWVIEHKDNPKAIVTISPSEHWTSLLVALKLADEEQDEYALPEAAVEAASAAQATSP